MYYYSRPILAAKSNMKKAYFPSFSISSVTGLPLCAERKNVEPSLADHSRKSKAEYLVCEILVSVMVEVITID